MKVTQTDSEVTIVFDKNSDEYNYGFLPLIKIADISYAEMVDFAAEFNSQLAKSDPKTQMAKTWDETWNTITDADMDSMMRENETFRSLIAKFYNQIGEALGPIAYTGFELRCWFKENYPDDIRYQDWVDECISIYSDSSFVK